MSTILPVYELPQLIASLEAIAKDPVAWGRKFLSSHALVYKLNPRIFYGGLISLIFTIAAFKHPKYSYASIPFAFVSSICFYKSRDSELKETADSLEQRKKVKTDYSCCMAKLNNEITKKVDYIYNFVNDKPFSNLSKIKEAIDSAAQTYDSSVENKENYDSLKTVAKQLIEYRTENLNATKVIFERLQRSASYYLEGNASSTESGDPEQGDDAYVKYRYVDHKAVLYK